MLLLEATVLLLIAALVWLTLAVLLLGHVARSDPGSRRARPGSTRERASTANGSRLLVGGRRTGSPAAAGLLLGSVAAAAVAPFSGAAFILVVGSVGFVLPAMLLSLRTPRGRSSRSWRSRLAR
jgi:hypothetical protein